MSADARPLKVAPGCGPSLAPGAGAACPECGVAAVAYSPCMAGDVCKACGAWLD